MPKAKWSVRGREWHGGSLGEDMAWTVCVYHSTHTPTVHVPHIPVPVYLHVRVRVVQGVRDEEQGRLTSPRANAIGIYDMSIKYDVICRGLPCGG